MTTIAQTAAVLIRLYREEDNHEMPICLLLRTAIRMGLLEEDESKAFNEYMYSTVQKLSTSYFPYLWPKFDHKPRVAWLRSVHQKLTGRYTIDFYDWYYDYLTKHHEKRNTL